MIDPMIPRFRSGLRGAVVATFATLALVSPSAAEQFEVKLNEYEIERTLTPAPIDITKPISVFGAILSALPEKVTVYPTESYYYFSFFHEGVNYNGNIRFDAFDQFDGKVHFAYAQEYVYWRESQGPAYKKLGPEDGVKVEKIDKLNYRITYKDTSVHFNLVDLSKVKPPEGALLPDETYIGPVWDESGIQLYLIFNTASQTFLYVLNEEAKPADVYEPLAETPDILVGARTSFAFHKDKLADRKILIGVFSGNSQVNNYFDGPFDQLPDNFVEGNVLRDAILVVAPWMKGKIDRYGSLPDGSERYAITPYVYYDFVEDLKKINDCAKTAEPVAAEYYGCFNNVMLPPEGEEGEGEPADDAQKAPEPPAGEGPSGSRSDLEKDPTRAP